MYRTSSDPRCSRPDAPSRPHGRWHRVLATLPILVLLAPGPVSAVILYGSGDPSFNSSPPTNSLQGGGWQYQGRWGHFLATPVAQHYFLNAAHLGGQVGDQFLLNGAAWTFVRDAPFEQAGGFTLTRIAPRADWIRSVIQNSPAPRVILEVASHPTGPFQPAANFTVNTSLKRLTVPPPTDSSFFRLRACHPTRIHSLRFEAGVLVVDYE